jgi:hypothetical protein
MFRDAHGLEVFKIDPAFGLAHCLKCYFAMLGYKQSGYRSRKRRRRTQRGS